MSFTVVHKHFSLPHDGLRLPATYGDTGPKAENTHMATESKAIKEVVKAAQHDLQVKNKTKAESLRVKMLERGKRAAERRVRDLEEAPNTTQLAIASGASVAGGFGGYKLREYLAGTTVGQAVDTEGNPTFGAKATRTGVPVGLGLALTIGGAFLPGFIAPAVMGGGAGMVGGALISAFK